tara:strand:+ start:319 stop:597 length:279 start_codon:yes stop_codon:yes gene_type:complete
MKKYIFVPLITCLIIFTSIIKNSTRELETEIFNYEEKIKMLNDDREMILLQNNYLSSPERLFELKKKFFGDKLQTLEIKRFKYLTYNEKRIF